MTEHDPLYDESAIGTVDGFLLQRPDDREIDFSVGGFGANFFLIFPYMEPIDVRLKYRWVVEDIQ